MVCGELADGRARHLGRSRLLRGSALAFRRRFRRRRRRASRVHLRSRQRRPHNGRAYEWRYNIHECGITERLRSSSHAIREAPKVTDVWIFPWKSAAQAAIVASNGTKCRSRDLEKRNLGPPGFEPHKQENHEGLKSPGSSGHNG